MNIEYKKNSMDIFKDIVAQLFCLQKQNREICMTHKMELIQ
jgi:hypothetical protein